MPTEAELEREERQQIEDRRAGGEDFNKRSRSYTSRRPAHDDIRRVLAGGKRLKGEQIAAALGVTTRDVQQVLCNVIYMGQPWLKRTKAYGEPYVYFLARG